MNDQIKLMGRTKKVTKHHEPLQKFPSGASTITEAASFLIPACGMSSAVAMAMAVGALGAMGATLSKMGVTDSEFSFQFSEFRFLTLSPKAAEGGRRCRAPPSGRATELSRAAKLPTPKEISKK